MSHHRLLPLLLTAALFAGCPDRQPPAPPAADKPGRSPTDEATGDQAEATNPGHGPDHARDEAAAPARERPDPTRRPTFDALDDEAAAAWKDKQASFSTHLNAGRRATRAGELDKAVGHLEKALAIRPDDPTALGELGWALYNKGERSKARRVTLRALDSQRERGKRAAMLYNLGRIAQDDKDPAAAADAYRRSLALRDSEEVERRLEAVEASAGAPTGVTLESLCGEAMAHWVCAPEPTDDMTGECSCEVTRTLVNPDGKHIKRAAVLTVTGHAGLGGSIDGAGHLAVETASGGWQPVGLLTHAFSPGVSYIHHDGSIDEMAFEPLTGFMKALVVTTTNREDDGDYGSNTTDYLIARDLTVCYVLDTPRCARVPVGRTWGTQPMLGDAPAPPPTGSWSVNARVDGKGSLFTTVTDAQDEPAVDDPASGMMGVHPIQAVEGMKHVELIPLR